MYFKIYLIEQYGKKDKYKPESDIDRIKKTLTIHS